MSIFIDTSVLIGASLREDPWHAKAREIVFRIGEGQYGPAYSSDYVALEAFNFIRQKIRRREPAVAIKGFLFGDEDTPPSVRWLYRVHGGRFAKALSHYIEEFDRGLSLADWTTVVLMREERIGALATFDSGFGGFVNVVRA